jgi:hypothetical protein
MSVDCPIKFLMISKRDGPRVIACLCVYLPTFQCCVFALSAWRYRLEITGSSLGFCRVVLNIFRTSYLSLNRSLPLSSCIIT